MATGQRQKPNVKLNDGTKTHRMRGTRVTETVGTSSGKKKPRSLNIAEM